MSHTDKDRPLWVKHNDETMLRSIVHRHYLFGKTEYRRVPVRDAQGKQVRVTRTYTRSVLNPFRIYRVGISFDRLWVQETYEVEEPVFEYVPLYTYPNHCTGDYGNKNTRGGEDALPCTPEVLLDGIYRYDKPPKSEQRGYHRTIRTEQRSVLRNYEKEVNGADSWDDLDDSHVEARVNDFPQDYWS